MDTQARLWDSVVSVVAEFAVPRKGGGRVYRHHSIATDSLVANISGTITTNRHHIKHSAEALQ